MHPMVDASKMTDAQIHEAMSKCYMRKAHAETYGQQLMSQQIDMMIDVYRNELSLREQAAILAKEKKERKNKSDEITFGEISKDDDIQDSKY